MIRVSIIAIALLTTCTGCDFLNISARQQQAEDKRRQEKSEELKALGSKLQKFEQGEKHVSESDSTQSSSRD